MDAPRPSSHSPSVIWKPSRRVTRVTAVDWFLRNAFWVLGAAALLVGLLFYLHLTLRTIRLRASLFGLALLSASIILWPTRLWIAQHRPGTIADPTILITIALWLALAAIPLAIVGRPRLAPLIALASVVTVVVWFRTAVPPNTAFMTILHVSRPAPAQQNEPRGDGRPARPTERSEVRR